MPINIWLASWNCENQSPNDNMFNDFIVNDVNNAIVQGNAPDLIVIGLQEAEINSSVDRRFLSQRLAKLGVLGQHYQHIASSQTIGTLKGKQSSLQLGVLAKRNPAITIFSKQTGNYRDSIESKGGAFVKFRYRDNTNNRLVNQNVKNRYNSRQNMLRMGFINAHLEPTNPIAPKNSNKNDSQLTGFLREFIGLNSNATATEIRQRLDYFDTVIFMGDLNYLLTSKPIEDLQRKVYKVSLQPDSKLTTYKWQATFYMKDSSVVYYPAEKDSWESSTEKVLFLDSYQASGWVMFTVVDEEGYPVANEVYQVTLPDGTVRQGQLNAKGQARLDRVPMGNCTISFPNIDANDWQPL